MEHRYGKRFAANLKTLIFKNGIPVAIGRIRNISRYGAFVETEYQGVGINQLLQIEIRKKDRVETEMPRSLCRMFVVHQTDDGFGMALHEECGESQNHFAAVLIDEIAQFSALAGINADDQRPRREPLNRLRPHTS